MANFEREEQLVAEIRSAASGLIAAIDRARSVMDRQAALGSTFADQYFAPGAPGEGGPMTAQLIADAGYSLTAAIEWLAAGHATNLHRVRT